MMLSDDDVFERIRTTLDRWAAEEPVAAPPPLRLEVPQRAGASGRRLGPWLVAAAATVALVVAGAVAWTRRSDPQPPVDVGPPSAITVIPVGERWGVRSVAVTDDAVWMTSSRDEVLVRIDPTTDRVVATFPIPDHVEGVVAAGGSLWLSRYEPHEVIRIDPDTGEQTGRLEFETQPALATDGEQLWVVAGAGERGTAFRIDPRTATVVSEVPLGAPAGFATVGNGSVWIANFGTTNVTRVDPEAARVSAVVDVGAQPRDLVLAGDSLWVATNGAGVEQPGSVVRVDHSDALFTSTVATGRGIHSLSASADAVWVTNQLDGTLSVIDAASGDLIATTPIGDSPGAVAVGHGSIWVAPFRRTTLLRLDPNAPLEAAAVSDLRRAVAVSNGTVYVRCSGEGRPTVLLEADAQAGAGSWAIVESRVAHSTRVCSYDRVGIADASEAGSAGPASSVASDLGLALDAVGEDGPFVVVGQGSGGLFAQMFATTHRDRVEGLVLVNGIDETFLQAVRTALPAAARAKFEDDLRVVPELQHLEASATEVAALTDLGTLPLLVLADGPVDPEVGAERSDPPLTADEFAVIDALRQDTARRLAELSSEGRPVVTDAAVAPDDIVEAISTMLG